MGRLIWSILRPLLVVLGLIIGLLAVHLMVFETRPVPLTPLMVIRAVQGEGIDQRWVGIDEMSPGLARAVIASEDNRFCEHDGIDWNAVSEVVSEYKSHGHLRGASTISMQTVKNLYLWPGRSVFRKAFEVVLVQVLERAWSKKRIMEVYLNIVELGPGVYGVEAASQHHFGLTARRLKPAQAAALAAILPAPRRRDPSQKNRAMGKRVSRILMGVKSLGPLLDCVPPEAVRPKRSRSPSPSADGFPVHLEAENDKSEDQATPNKPRHRKLKKGRAKRRRRSR